MSVDHVNIGRNAASVSVSPAFAKISRVTVNVGTSTDADGNTVTISYTAGNDTGRELAFDCPWGTQAVADDVLAAVKGYEYQPFDAAGALIDPATELGDAVTVRGTYSCICKETITADQLYHAEISAPYEEEVDHEYPYDETERESIRAVSEVAGAQASLKIDVDQIRSTVSQKIDGTTAQTMINQTVGNIALTAESGSGSAAIVLDNGVGSTSSVGLTLSAVEGDNQSTITILANGITMDSQVVKFGSIEADSITASAMEAIEITADQITAGKLDAESLELNGLMPVVKNNTLIGYIGYARGSDGQSTTDGIVICDSGKTNGIVITDAGLRMHAGNDCYMYLTQSGAIHYKGTLIQD